jgi:hypothetical protein
MPAPNKARDFWQRVAITDGCWEISGTAIRGGYVPFSFQGRKVLAHRLSWELAGESIPEGMKVCHRCDNPRCVRFSHLFLGSQADNIADMVSKGRSANRFTHSRPIRCPRGHVYADSGRVDKRGKIRCLTCDSARTRAYYAAHAERIKAERRARWALHGPIGAEDD